MQQQVLSQVIDINWKITIDSYKHAYKLIWNTLFLVEQINSLR